MGRTYTVLNSTNPQHPTLCSVSQRSDLLSFLLFDSLHVLKSTNPQHPTLCSVSPFVLVSFETGNTLDLENAGVLLVWTNSRGFKAALGTYKAGTCFTSNGNYVRISPCFPVFYTMLYLVLTPDITANAVEGEGTFNSTGFSVPRRNRNARPTQAEMKVDLESLRDKVTMSPVASTVLCAGDMCCSLHFHLCLQFQMEQLTFAMTRDKQVLNPTNAEDTFCVYGT
jgi:hypothetical protein